MGSKEVLTLTTFSNTKAEEIAITSGCVRTYRSKQSIDVKNPNAPKVSTNKAEKEGYRVRNPKEVAMKPKDMPYNGFLPTNKRFK